MIRFSSESEYMGTMGRSTVNLYISFIVSKDKTSQ